MRNNRRNWIVALAGSLLAAASLFHSPAAADVGVQPVLPGGSNIQPDDGTPIQMASEVVTMNVRAATAADNSLVDLNPEAYGYNIHPVWYPGAAEVTAEFRMVNPTADKIVMTVWFPLASALENVDWNFNPEETVPRIENFSVSADGKPLPTTVSELPNPKGADKPRLPWASFPVTFAGSSETEIVVRYTLPLQPSIKGNEMSLYYIFQTGAGWAGTIGRADLIVNLPYPASEGTMAGIQPGHFQLPYMVVTKKSAALPADAVLEGNQARWTWTNFEPGPEDDFAIWLLLPEKWKVLEQARAAVQSNPQNGHAWLNLAVASHFLTFTPRNSPTLFSNTYLAPAEEAYLKVIELLPEHPAGHAGLALLTLAPYMAEKNAPADVLQLVEREFRAASNLEAANPTMQNETGNTQWLLAWLEEALANYAYNSATATAEWSAWSTNWANETAEAAAQVTPSMLSTQTPRTITTLTPSPTQTAEIPSMRVTIQILIIAAGLILLMIAAYFIHKRR